MSRSLRRLMKEASELSNSPSPHFHAQPISESNLFDWHFTLEGPPAPSPYAGGIYHGRIVLPPTYPLRPPSFRFLTPSGRFEVNREICLSISGHHEETWQPAWGIRTALLAIRTFMDGNARGQVGGLDVSDEVRREYARSSHEWRCDACDGGKTNEEVLLEWREICREKGVDVEKEEEGELPEGLTLAAPKKTSNDNSSGSNGNGNGGSANRDEGASIVPATVSPAAPMQETTLSSTQSIQARPPQSRQLPQPVQQATAPGGVPQTTNRIGLAPAPSPASVASRDSPWLDRAIFGVLVMLVLMVLRRIASLEDY